MEKEEIIQLYNSLANSYDARVFEEKDYTAFEKIPDWILSSLPNDQKIKILDLGCGTGLGSLKFFQKNFSVTGIDISLEMLEKAKKLPYFKLICQSLEESFPFGSEKFSAAILLGVMEFIKQPEALFKKIHSFLSAPALFGLTVPKKLSNEIEKKLDIFTYTDTDIEKVFSNSSFSIKQKEIFQGFISEGQTIYYYGYLLQKKTLIKFLRLIKKTSIILNKGSLC